MTQENTQLKARLKKTSKTLKKQQETVVIPLIEQVRVRENELRVLRETTKRESRHIKMLSSILRFPQMCDQYRRISKLRMSDEQIKEAQKEATLVLRQYDLDDNPVNTNR